MRPNPTYCPIKVPRRHVRYGETYVRATLYVSPYLVATPKGYTKHYYAGAERVASQMGRGKFSDVNTSIADSTATAAKRNAVLTPIRNRQQITSSNVQFFAYLSSLTNRLNDTSECYFYHPDHLGSSSWITDSAGTAVQHLHYLPFGETFVSQRSADFDAMYTFSAKEKDTETGYSYFGARYYSSDLSVWLSVDPMTAKYPSLSPYTYCANNPVRCVDPNGEDYTNFEDENGKLLEHIEDGSNAVFKLNRSPIVKNAKTGKFEKNNNAYFAFSRYDQSQNGIDEVNVQSVIDYAQTYTRKTFTADGKQTYCNYAAKFIALSFNSAVTELGGVST